MKLDLFADGIANVSIASGVVRIDFYVSRPGSQPGNTGGPAEPERDIHLSVNLPLSTFVGSMNVLQRLMSELMQRGIITGRPSEAQRAPDA